MTKKNILRLLLIILSVIFLSITAIEILRSITDWPKVRLKLTPSQGETVKTISIWDYLPDIVVPFVYFTTWTNIQVFGSLFYTIVFKKKLSMCYKISVMVNASLTFFVFSIFLAPLLPWGQNPWFDFIYVHEHLNMFLITLFWFSISIGRAGTRAKKAIWLSLSMPLVFLVLSTALYIWTGTSVYPFLNYLNIFNLRLHYLVSYYLTILFLVLLAACISTSALMLHRVNNFIFNKRLKTNKSLHA